VTDTPQLLLAHHLKALKLPTFLREYDKLARQCAAEGLDHIRFLLRLAELELIDRERRMVERRIKEARFPSVKSLDSFDFAAIPSLNKTLVLELARSEYVTRREISSRSATAAPARPTLVSGSVSRPVKRVCRSDSIPPRPSSMNCWRRATRSDCFACSGSSPDTGF
jgi:hypothetical protein